MRMQKIWVAAFLLLSASLCLAGLAGGVPQSPQVAQLRLLEDSLQGSRAAGDSAAEADALIQRGRLLQSMGALGRAVDDLRAAVALAGAASYQRKGLLAEILLANALLAIEPDEEALQALENLQKQADSIGWQPVSALALNLLGGHYGAQGRSADAVRAYHRCLDLAHESGDRALQAQVRINLARLAGPGQRDDARALLKDAWELVAGLESETERAEIAVALGYQALRLSEAAGGSADMTRLAFTALEQARTVFERQGDYRGGAQALGYLGRLYEDAGRIDPAFDLTGRAILKAQAVNAHDQLLLWEWQLGRLEQAKGHTQAALQALRRAVAHIEAIRQDIPIRYKDGRSSFRETLEPVYLGLADLLLKRAIELDADAPRQQALLREARATVELVKQTELEDYFASRCSFAAAPEVGLEQVAGDVAALYPILLEDRLGLLVSLADSISLRYVDVPAATVEAEARAFSSMLRDPTAQGDYRASAARMYDWLIRPVEDLLADNQITTLIYLPDRALRLVPPAVLFDGEHFLVERYRSVISPGLQLLDPKPLPRGDMQTLLAGLSDPGEVVLHLPRPLLAKLARAASNYRQQASVSGQRDLTGVLSRQLAKDMVMDEDELDRLLQDPEIVDLIREFLRIPGVVDEINTLKKVVPSSVILNSEFARSAFQQELLGESPYRVVHVASHGVFGGSAEESFVMAYDNILDMNNLEDLLGAEKFRDSPIELLTLSACQTAEGDDRSPLGISGLALKARVRSALGSLWPVSDEATSALMQGFYARLKQPELTKAEALRQAQEAILHVEGFEHPFYWSPFILIGNWL